MYQAFSSIEQAWVRGYASSSTCREDEDPAEENNHCEVSVTNTSSCSTSTSITNRTCTITAPTDIASDAQNCPTQPRNHQFPSTKFGDRLRAFNPLWYDTYTWLEYSILEDAAYCFACRFFSPGPHRDDNTFTTSGFKNWKNATGKSGKLEKHNTSERHHHAMLAWRDYEANVSQNRSIGSVLNKQRAEQVVKNRHYIKTLLQIIKYCAFQEVAMRGHREVDAKNKGNFLELLSLVSEHDPVVKSRLQDGPKNALYTSHGIQE